MATPIAFAEFTKIAFQAAQQVGQRLAQEIDAGFRGEPSPPLVQGRRKQRTAAHALAEQAVGMKIGGGMNMIGFAEHVRDRMNRGDRSKDAISMER